MSRIFRNWVAVVSALAMIAISAAPAAANTEYDQRSNAPVMVDVLILRPLGFVALASGLGVFALVAPVMLVSRPQEIHKPFHALVIRPAEYVWADRLGSH